MSIKDKQSIKHKIKALLSKKIESGATQAEAAVAMQKAQELMAKYMITQTELSFKSTECIELEIKDHPSSYNLSFIHPQVAALFDAMCWRTGTRGNIKAIYFGFEEDVELASYFYNYLCNMIESEALKYKASTEYRRLVKNNHARTVINAFIKGLQIQLIHKIDEQIAQKRKTVSTAGGSDLITIKHNIIQDEFNSLGIRLRSSRASFSVNQDEAYKAGNKRGKEIEINQGLKNQGNNSRETLSIGW